jgi:hypothetical protein
LPAARVGVFGALARELSSSVPQPCYDFAVEMERVGDNRPVAQRECRAEFVVDLREQQRSRGNPHTVERCEISQGVSVGVRRMTNGDRVMMGARRASATPA